MKKTLFVVAIIFIASLLAVSTAFALPANKGTIKADAASPAINNGQVVAPPPFVFQLPEDKLSKVVFIRYAPGKAPVCDNDGICEKGENAKKCPNDCGGGEEPKPSPCYDFLSHSKPKWNWVEDYYYSTPELGLATAQAAEIWEGATSGNIFGSGLPGIFKWGKYDYNNAISFGNYSDPNVIAVTAIWYRATNIYEYDVLYDTDYFPGDGLTDLATVVLHEMGHAAGLDDLYDSVCIDQVMYGYYQGALTTLGSGDITGIQTLYGN